MKKISLLLLTIVSLMACEKEKEYGVRSEFEPYVQKFIE